MLLYFHLYGGTEKNKVIIITKRIGRLLIVFLPIMTCILTLFQSKIPFINRLFSGRFFYTLRVLELYGLSLFPRTIQYQAMVTSNGTYTLYVDSGFMDLLIRHGIIIAAIYIFAYLYATNKAYKVSDWKWFYWLVLISVFSVVNNPFMNPFFDCSLYVIWKYVSLSGKERITKNA